MRVAWELGRTEEEIENMTVEEFSRWGAFLDMVTAPRAKGF